MNKNRLIEWLKKHKQVFNIYSLELLCGVPRNTIAHAIGKEKRELKDEHAALIVAKINIMVRLYLSQKKES